ncbi:MAG: class II fructose-bisphosphate aldolase, partial [Actinomycetota bacterium]|nr:class II fructose-bisphosphate aldolase [Actinomycetota bacterium]
MVLVSPSSFEGTGGERLVHGFKAAVTRVSTDVLIQLDHVSDLSAAERAVRCGVDAVMAEGSKLSFPVNLAFICAAASIPVPRQALSGFPGTSDGVTLAVPNRRLGSRGKALVGKRTDLAKVGALPRVQG